MQPPSSERMAVPETDGAPQSDARRRLRPRVSEIVWRINVAIVDDDAADASLIKLALGHEQSVGSVSLHSVPDDALFKFAEGVVRPDLILLDIHMPKVNGFTFMSALREIPAMAHTPVAFLTTSRHSRDVERSRSCDVVGYIVKPDSFEELQERISGVIRSVASGGWSR
jgi:CheY-like chemotaxis protein